MLTESSNPDCIPPTETQHTPLEADAPNAVSVAPTQRPALAVTAVASGESLPGSRSISHVTDARRRWHCRTSLVERGI